MARNPPPSFPLTPLVCTQVNRGVRRDAGGQRRGKETRILRRRRIECYVSLKIVPPVPFWNLHVSPIGAIIRQLEKRNRPMCNDSKHTKGVKQQSPRQIVPEGSLRWVAPPGARPSVCAPPRGPYPTLPPQAPRVYGLWDTTISPRLGAAAGAGVWRQSPRPSSPNSDYFRAVLAPEPWCW